MIHSGFSFSQNEFRLTDSTFEVGQTYVIRNIYFDFNNGMLILDSNTRMTLDSVVNFLNSHENINFEIGFHTSWRASEKYNLKLSEIRARQIRAYLCAEGVKEDQLTSKGYGESIPLHSKEKMETLPNQNAESLEKMHLENQRTVLKILSID